MTLSELQELLHTWIREDVDDELGMRETKSRIDFLGDRLFNEYIGGIGAAAIPFAHKLAAWLASESDNGNQRLMFRLLNYLAFYGAKELELLYKTVYSRNVLSWLLDKSGMDLLSPDTRSRLEGEVRETCFVALTDSFKIGEFVRLNALQDVPLRITFSSIRPAPSADQFKNHYLQGRKRLVLFEDFVGSGTQVLENVQFASELGENQPEVLFSPLIICPSGHENAIQLATRYPHLTYEPVISLLPRDFVTQPLSSDAPALFEEFRQLARDLHPKVRGPSGGHDHGPLGYCQTGAIFVKYDNCPDNTLPLIHRRSSTPWNPLFLRVTRGD